MLLLIIQNKKVTAMKKKLRCKSLLCLAVFLSTTLSDISHAENQQYDISVKEQNSDNTVRFNTAFLKEFNQGIDLSWLESESGIQPGRHVLEIFLNGKNLRTQKVEFIAKEGKTIPCISKKILSQIAFKDKNISDSWEKQECIDLGEILPGSLASYDHENERLILTIPQIYFFEQPEGYIDPSRWDEGINALSASYSLSGSNTILSKQNGRSMIYGNLQTTLRIGAWRFHTYDSLIAGSMQQSHIQHLQSYAQRSVAPLLSELSLGDLNTSGEFFDTTSLRGVILKSDERMLPWTVKGYAPEVRGIAYSNAIVTIRQNGNVIYEKNVTPGEFNISNLAALGYGGNLDVTVIESNGVVRTFQIPYSSIPQLLRKGYFKYSVATGEARRLTQVTSQSLLESTLQYGLTDNITLYGGLQTTFEKNYNAVNGGTAFNTPLGAISTDITHAFVPQELKIGSGNSLVDSSRLKLSYSKLVSQTNTHFNIASYYMAGNNFYSFDELMRARSRQYDHREGHIERYRNKFEMAITQDLPDEWGQMALSGWWEKNNNTHRNNTRSSYLFSYRNNYDSVNYSVNVNKVYNFDGKEDTALILNASMPFGFKKGARPKLRASMSYSNSDAVFRTSLSGSTQKDDSSTSFNTYFSQSSKTNSNFGINVGHTTNKLQKNISYSQSMNSSSLAGSLSGGILLHGEGVNFSSYMGETIALVEAKSAEGASIKGHRNSRVGSNGFGVMSYLRPYEENILNLDLKGAPIGFDTEEDSLEIVPTAGAVVKVKFNNNNQNNKSVIARIKTDSGNFIPFGARLYDESDNIYGTSGQGGITILSLPDEFKLLKVTWLENGNIVSCHISPSELENSIASMKAELTTVDLRCHKK
ncbi:hypothetical protein SY86_13885 [Erwinia tracheiphila]|uniref:Fimbrial biogenesis outer membrane usher protein n=2 Tax=Erwinia tracheiphila TaxID=65700 RepID=A0A0M2KA53_9GAMM|nr:hypothetical protein SY86_13885 [Erwinia tracheiphila]